MCDRQAVPAHVVLEIAATCNLRCRGCALHGPNKFVTRPFGVMSEANWRRAIAEIGDWQQPLTLSLNGGGEPLLHRQLKTIVMAAKAFPRLDTGFLTNGVFFDREWANWVIEQQLDWLAFSIDGVEPATFKKLRQGAELAQVEANLEYLLHVKKRTGAGKPLVFINMVAYDEIVDQREAFVSKWLSRVDKVMISHYRNPPSSRRWPGKPSGSRRPCSLLSSQMVIGWDGRLGLCCEDFNLDIELGHLGTGSLLESWNGPLMQRYRQAHLRGDYGSLELCRDCDTWAADDLLAEEIEPRQNYRLSRRVAQDIYTLL